MSWTSNEERLQAAVEIALDMLHTGRVALAAEVLRLALQDSVRAKRAAPPLMTSRDDLLREAERLHATMRDMLADLPTP
jgi:hypothetical protein